MTGRSGSRLAVGDPEEQAGGGDRGGLLWTLERYFSRLTACAEVIRSEGIRIVRQGPPCRLSGSSGLRNSGRLGGRMRPSEAGQAPPCAPTSGRQRCVSGGPGGRKYGRAGGRAVQIVQHVWSWRRRDGSLSLSCGHPLDTLRNVVAVAAPPVPITAKNGVCHAVIHWTLSGEHPPANERLCAGHLACCAWCVVRGADCAAVPAGGPHGPNRRRRRGGRDASPRPRHGRRTRCTEICFQYSISRSENPALCLRFPSVSASCEGR